MASRMICLAAAMLVILGVATTGGHADPPAPEAPGREAREAAVRARADEFMRMMREREAQAARREEAEWGPEQGGLRVRVWSAPDTLRIGDAFPLELGIKGNPATLPLGRDLIDLQEFADSLTIELVSVKVPSPVRMVLHPQGGLLPALRGPIEPRNVTEKPLAVRPMRFSTTPLEAQLQDGMYLCTVKVEVRDHARDAAPAASGGIGDEKRMRLWYGAAASKPFAVELFRGEPGTEVVYIPRVLRAAEGRTFFTREDADRKSFIVPKGSLMGVGTEDVVFETDAAGVRRQRTLKWGIGGNYLRPGDARVGPPLPIGSAVRLTIFSTNEPIGHLWQPAAGSAYKMLLQRWIPIIGEKDDEPGAGVER